jgi:acyl-coenzyme A synthetase/AMP-(fatty) acid ligase
MLLHLCLERKLYKLIRFNDSLRIPTKPGSATLPFFGVRPVILDNDGGVIEGPGEGNLCFKAAWPGIRLVN